MISRRRMLSLGMSPAQIKRVVRGTPLTPVRRGWYAATNVEPSVLRAVELGGALSCWQALAIRGAWQPPVGDGSLHIRVAECSGPLPGATVHAAPVRAGLQPVIDPIDPPALAMLCMAKCLPWNESVAVLDSAVRVGIIHADDCGAVLEMAGGIGGRILDALDPSAESGLESLLRLRLLGLGLPIRTQVWIQGILRADFLIGDRLVVEADGRAYHTGEAAHQRDVDRDNALKRLGYLSYHFTYSDVVHKPGYVEDVLVPLIRRGEHRWNSRNCTWKRDGLADPDRGAPLTRRPVM